MQRKHLVFIVFVISIASSQAVECGPNEIPGPSCGTACPPTCEVRTPEACIDICIIDACVCKPGFIRLENRSSPCVPESDCPTAKKCGPHEVFTKCDYTTCVPACNRRGPIFCPAQGISCKSGCLCQKGFVRLDWQNPKSRCVRPSECPCCKG